MYFDDLDPDERFLRLFVPASVVSDVDEHVESALDLDEFFFTMDFVFGFE